MEKIQILLEAVHRLSNMILSRFTHIIRSRLWLFKLCWKSLLLPTLFINLKCLRYCLWSSLLSNWSWLIFTVYVINPKINLNILFTDLFLFLFFHLISFSFAIRVVLSLNIFWPFWWLGWSLQALLSFVRIRLIIRKRVTA